MDNQRLQKLIFIYNADSGLRNSIVDSVHKIVSPSTYDCKLCEITFGALTENKTWKKFREATNFEMEFLHKDEFRKQYASKFGHKFSYPIVLADAGQGLEVFVSTEELNAMGKAEELIRLIGERANV